MGFVRHIHIQSLQTLVAHNHRKFGLMCQQRIDTLPIESVPMRSEVKVGRDRM
jgi:hypothetical protein